MPNDSHISAAEERRLRIQLAELTRKREQRYAEWDRVLAAGERERDTALASQEAALTAKVAELSQQLSDTLAEVAELDDEPAGQRQGGLEQEAAQAEVFQSAEEAAAAAGPWSPAFKAWRAEHIPSSRGLF